jgi:hypothetical protein
MGDIVNLRRARKAKARATEDAKAAVNRIAFGRSGNERKLTEATRELETRRLEAHRRETEKTRVAPQED